jgi:response regulator RpfG family c-di-GMP phosphodiesterase
MVMNILIVDDSSLTRKAIRRTLGMIDLEFGEIFEAENGSLALKVMDESRIDLVLADLNMPEMGGIEMIQRMKSGETTRSIPVVIISTESSMTRIKELLSQGVRDYLHKPFAPEEFRNIISHTMESRHD